MHFWIKRSIKFSLFRHWFLLYFLGNFRKDIKDHGPCNYNLGTYLKRDAGTCQLLKKNNNIFGFTFALGTNSIVSSFTVFAVPSCELSNTCAFSFWVIIRVTTCSVNIAIFTLKRNKLRVMYFKTFKSESHKLFANLFVYCWHTHLCFCAY